MDALKKQFFQRTATGKKVRWDKVRKVLKTVLGDKFAGWPAAWLV